MSKSTPVFEALRSVELAPAQSYENLSVLPLLARVPWQADYAILDEALAGGRVLITELGEGGSVPELSVTNSGQVPVLLVDGEELVGAKQNRVLNLTILVPAHSTLTIPVSCVERGRWRHTSRGFRSAPRAQFAEGRAAKMRDVTASLRQTGTRHSDQSEVWSRIADKSARLGAASETGAMAAMFEQAQAPIERFVEAFPSQAGQAGGIFFINGRIAGLELFDAPATWRKLAPKLLRSYALDAIDRRGAPRSGSADEAPKFLECVAQSEASVFPATGLGSDVRLSSPALSGAALVVGGRAVHISAFAE
jgi:hypothetical protein